MDAFQFFVDVIQNFMIAFQLSPKCFSKYHEYVLIIAIAFQFVIGVFDGRFSVFRRSDSEFKIFFQHVEYFKNFCNFGLFLLLSGILHNLVKDISIFRANNTFFLNFLLLKALCSSRFFTLPLKFQFLSFS